MGASIAPHTLAPNDLVWVLGSLCALHGKSFSAELLAQKFPATAEEPHSEATLVHAATELNFKIRKVTVVAPRLAGVPLPLLVQTRSAQTSPHVSEVGLAIITAVQGDTMVMFEAGSSQPQTVSSKELATKLTGVAWLIAPEVDAVSDTDAIAASTTVTTQQFGFRWFVPELMRHKKVWRDVLVASLAMQVVALTTPLFTQAIIDKVVVHRTQSTLLAIAIAMAIFVLFNGVMTWGRQYLVLHTGNRIDAVLGAAVWEHLLHLPLRYFEHRPTGVVAARLHAVETIREFVSGAAISLILDLPFLLICLGVMLYYSVLLTAIVVGLLAVIALASFVMAPVFQKQLNEQFLLGARNQAFVTEHIAGFETVKTLQMEPQLSQRYSGYLATLLASAFKTKQIANTYNTFANTLEQAMTLAVLVVGAYLVMVPEAPATATGNNTVFTVGMLVAFQMFASKLSQPVLRIVGLWTQFQQATLSVQRLGDVMNAPTEPYSLVPKRSAQGQGHLQIAGLGFRYSDQHPLLYDNLNLNLTPGQSLAIMGASGSGKSTLAKLMLGFYQPTHGSIKIDGVDIRNLSANELRSYFGVVPQETMLFSGTILANLLAGKPGATLEQVVRATKMAGIHATIEQLP
jgi:ATP-binding cassette, subfamily B, bacterial HlyB/CyaB